MNNILPHRILPKSLADVDNGKILGFGADLSEEHPGFLDDAYRKRRVEISRIASTHEIGQPIPRINYSPEETEVWSSVLKELELLFPKYACQHYLNALPEFGFSQHSIPQLQDISALLQKSTGWQIRPVAGLLHPRDFLAGLAFKTFHSTQYVRHKSKPSYTPEPDVVHELIGHCCMLTNKPYSDLVQQIGLASLAADDKQIWHLTKCYWYTVEFGVVREGDAIKAFGAGILSSYGELEHMAHERADFVPFDPFQKFPAMEYKEGYQKQYFVLDSFEDGAEKLHAYCNHLQEGLPPQVKAAIKAIKMSV